MELFFDFLGNKNTDRSRDLISINPKWVNHVPDPSFIL